MGVGVVVTWEGHRLEATGPIAEAANAFLAHLGARGYARATVRAYAYDVANFAAFLGERGLALGEVVPSDLFDYLDWQQGQRRRPGGKVAPLRRAGPAPATMNRRISAVRGLFEHQVMAGSLAENPVPAARRANGLRTPPRGLLGHAGPGRPRGGGRLVRQADRLPESIDGDDVAVFLADLLTSRDRAIALAMVLGGLRAGEVRSLRLPDVDMGLGRVRVVGKGDRERVVPIDRAFFVEVATYLREERPPGCATPECFVVLRGPTRGRAMTEPVVMEVLAGARDDAKEGELRRLLLRFELLRFDTPTDFDAAVRVYRLCRRKGVTPRGLIDCMVAAVAMRTGAALLAADADFGRMADVLALDLDDVTPRP